MPITTPSSIRRAAISPAACSNCSATSATTANCKRVRRAISFIRRHPGGRRLVVWPLGRELHLRHLAGAARPARDRRRHAPGVDRPRARLAGELPERETAAGAKPAPATTIPPEGQRPEHRLADRVGAHGPHRRDAVRRTRRARSPLHLAAASTTSSPPKPPTAPGPSRRPPAPAFPSVFYLRYDMYRNNWPLLALATYRNYLDGTYHRPSWYQCEPVSE